MDITNHIDCDYSKQELGNYAEAHRQNQNKRNNLDRLLSQFKDQVKHDFTSWYLSAF